MRSSLTPSVGMMRDCSRNGVTTQTRLASMTAVMLDTRPHGQDGLMSVDVASDRPRVDGATLTEVGDRE